ncbi:exonuclease SbcCD subunit D [Halobium salinum]|uniref:Exonuclease SbcCD subunit D n=1 Tax=Halobium salinum TaxID=1364940 RepID=A0ABD5P6Z1_9EURY
MSQKTRLLCVGDTHLGRAETSDGKKGSHGQWAYIFAFEAAISIAIYRDADAIVHTGDIFETQRPSSTIVSIARRQLARLREAGIQFCYVPGDHDEETGRHQRHPRASRYEDVLQKIQLPRTPGIDDFMSEYQTFNLGRTPHMVAHNCALYGIPSSQRTEKEYRQGITPIQSDTSNQDGIFNIINAHAGISPGWKRARHDIPSVLGELPNRMSIDVLICGHLHRPEVREYPTDSCPLFINPGSPVRINGATNRNYQPQVTLLEFPNGRSKSTAGCIERERIDVPVTQSGCARLAEKAREALFETRQNRQDVTAAEPA